MSNEKKRKNPLHLVMHVCQAFSQSVFFSICDINYFVDHFMSISHETSVLPLSVEGLEVEVQQSNEDSLEIQNNIAFRECSEKQTIISKMLILNNSSVFSSRIKCFVYTHL